MGCDVCDEAQVQRLVEGTVAEHGRLDVMVAAAGIATVKPLVEMSLEEWRSVLAVDLDGVFLCTKHAGAAMAAAGGGSIINVASIKAFGGSPGTGHYGAAKAGVVSLTKTAALELRPARRASQRDLPRLGQHRHGRRQQGGARERAGVDFDAVIEHIQGRLGEPEEITGLALFLASDRSQFASGTAYVIDGGATASLV